jgi:5-methylcytosine-specific restriction protein A
MPIKAPRICGCGYKIAPDTACPCEQRQAHERHQRHDANRPNATQRGYSRQWRRVSANFLRTNRWCAMCGKPADLVDHIIPHKGNPDLFWDKDKNWQSLCAHCHNSTKQRLERTARSIATNG